MNYKNIRKLTGTYRNSYGLIKVKAVLLLLSITSANISAQTRAGDKQLPNVVFILADDVGYADLGVYGGKVPTPNIDSLAAQGMRFTDAHAPAALCAPSRFSLLTGSYPYRNGRPGGSWDVNNSSGFSHNGDRTKAGRHITVGEVMQEAGYRTAFFGKMHLGGDVYDKEGKVIREKAKLNTMDYSRGVGDNLNDHGFDYWLGLLSGIQHEPYAYFENGKFRPVNPGNPADNSSTRLLNNGFYRVSDNGLSEIVEAGRIPARGDVDYDSSQAGIILTEGAVGFIDKHLRKNEETGKDQPFMLYFSSQAIHVPHSPPFDFDGDPSTIDEQVYGVTGAMTSDVLYELDLQVGKIMDKLEEEGIADNTLIIFTSDNGALWPNVTHYGDPEHDNNGPLRDYKASVYEGGHRVPFIAKWGDGSETGSVIPPGTVSDQLIVGHDWVATMYELTQQQMEEDQAMDSASLLPVFTGQQAEDDPLHEFILYQAGFAYDGAIREGSLVLVVDRDNKATELYDLSKDLGQENNLIGEEAYKETVARLHQKFLKYNDHDNATVNPRTTKTFRAN
ncbi:sulfatase-like hydrolase/transferase [Sinomicrobium weinanense]|uniref:Arylsulfatase n=1 Tax=Sinomicrobium weinanense TaxID=2842200 RepID=A0A926JTG9_9FLAO|nr:sulfatase-like hydrolase/transferase [Sinomicrobium weinanense]MBC9797009.1 arylsulfatase [Sinomicrobium weinanense]MBU3123293.1 sulfatase-like hydrolase/transferase [Sinomicrobium weinanense]